MASDTVGIFLDRPDIEWLEFRRQFVEMGGQFHILMKPFFNQ